MIKRRHPVWPTQPRRSGVASIRFWETMAPFAADCFSFRAESFRPLVHQNRDSHASPEIVVQHADARGLVDGLIWPKTGFASIV
ncbi:hypothetical protein D6B98_23540 [Bradyrhizobium sp. LVM 105]|uniref:Uncharacterized protein n=1 Tax=Bradyrhizobium frederickii TaxID=2560054 RepID=A0A4Y9NNN7_9BRAD|nr:hypothetical protein D6B98_23540 [Bradyrhizobium sp. LVM 105]TFV69500.1 hypothetical protein E4K64_32820 [Bradyrhizobium frederickii]